MSRSTGKQGQGKAGAGPGVPGGNVGQEVETELGGLGLCALDGGQEPMHTDIQWGMGWAGTEDQVLGGVLGHS